MILLVGGSYIGVKYVFKRSTQEVAALKQRPDAEYYLEVDKELRMTVVDSDGQLSMEITGESVRLTADQQTAIFEGAQAKYFEGGSESINFSAGKIEYDTASEDFLLTGGLDINTRDGMNVEADEVEWRRGLGKKTGQRTHAPSFRFPKGVKVMSRDGNRINASYMQADKDLQYMEFVGNVQGELLQLSDTEFITERDLTDLDQLKLEDFEKLGFKAEQVIYDKKKQVMLATSRLYDRPFTIMDVDGRAVDVAQYQPQQTPVTFSKEKITIQANHLEAHIAEEWVSAVGNINMVVPPDTPNPGDDKALQVVKQYDTRIKTEEVEYFWGSDYIMTHSRTQVVQQDRLAMADRITYYGDEKTVFLDGDIVMAQGGGDWLIENQLIGVEDHDIANAVRAYTELYGDRCVVYLNNNDFIASGGVMLRQDDQETYADLIVYQDEIKRISADGNVKFRGKNDQSLVCKSLVYHNENDYLEVKGGASAALLLPAKFANDINRAIADSREEPRPAEIQDPPEREQIPHHDPTLGLRFGEDLRPIEPLGSGAELPPLEIPGDESAEETEAAASTEGFIADEPVEEAPVEDEPEGEGEGGNG